jgi:hypothetical protein
VEKLSNNCRRLVLQHRQSLITSAGATVSSIVCTSPAVKIPPNAEEQEASLIYHALMISIHDESKLKEPLFTELWCAVIIFNSAVALHQQQLTEGLCKSEILYRMAHDLAVSSDARMKMDMHAEGGDIDLLFRETVVGLTKQSQHAQLRYAQLRYGTKTFEFIGNVHSSHAAAIRNHRSIDGGGSVAAAQLSLAWTE